MNMNILHITILQKIISNIRETEYTHSQTSILV